MNDIKSYTIFENLLNKINQKYVALPPDQVKRNNRLLKIVIEDVLRDLRDRSSLFHNLYRNNFYGGSFYDGLKVTIPSEYDIDCILALPKIVEATVVGSDQPGYLQIVLQALQKFEKSDEARNGLDKLLDGNVLSNKKVKSWMESLLSGLTTNSCEICNDATGSKITAKYKVVKNGPAYKITINGDENGAKFSLDVDLVPCFTFTGDHWPKNGYRANPVMQRDSFFCIPKGPNDSFPLLWRPSFQEQEKELINRCAAMKPTIKLIKKIRDRYQHKIASYHIKTIFLWELETTGQDFWCNKPLSFVFALMLRKYQEYLQDGKIPNYWNKNNNLIGHLTDNTISCIANKIKYINEDIEKIVTTTFDIYTVVPYILGPEVDLESLKKEVTLGKKHLKQIGEKAGVKPEIQAAKSESAEDLQQALPICDIKNSLQRIEEMCLGMLSEQNRMLDLMTHLADRMERCEEQVKEFVMRDKLREIDDEVAEDLVIL